jgi:hypothetical protein
MGFKSSCSQFTIRSEQESKAGMAGRNEGSWQGINASTSDC